MPQATLSTDRNKNLPTHVTVRRPKTGEVPAQLVALYETFKSVDLTASIRLDFSQITWPYSLLILPIAARLRNGDSSLENVPASIQGQFDTIHFPTGVASESAFQTGNLLPIVCLSRRDFENRERLETAFLDRLMQPLIETADVQNAMFHPITELTNNIFEHSGAEYGWLWAQWHHAGRQLDVYIVDCGQGLAAGYEKEFGHSITDEQAMRQALSGVSTKHDRERGYGVRTAKRVVCEALQGDFAVISGNTGFYSRPEESKILQLSDFHWPGVIAMYQIPKPTTSIDIYPYLE